ncbi:MAG: cation:proton antiporter, partial [Campylobacterales bacterium]
IPASLMKKILLYLIMLYGFSLFISFNLNFSNIFIVLLPLISVGLVASLSKEYGKQEWINLSMTAGGIGEVVSIVLLTITSSALVSGFGIGLVESIVALSLFLVFMFILFRLMQLIFWWFPEVSTALMPYKDNKEQDIRLSMGIFFLLIATMLYLHLELAFGAFLAGIFIPSFFEHKQELPEKLASFGFGFLIPVFFVHIGYTFNLEALAMDGLIQEAIIIALAIIFMRVVASSVFFSEVSKTEAILVGLSHSMPLTLLIAMATLAYSANSIDTLHYYAFILAAIFQVIFVMIAIRILNTKLSL